MGKYYRLKNHIVLRGWNGLPFGIVDQITGHTDFRFYRISGLISLCTGEVDFEGLFFTDEDRQRLQEVQREGFLDCFPSAQPRITKEQEFKKYPNAYIDTVQWSITGRCNYHCRHCYMDAPCGTGRDVSLGEAEIITEEFVKAGVFSVSLTGGEPLVHPDFWKIVDLLLEKGIRVATIYTNGFLIDEHFFDNLNARGIKPRISLSYDGAFGMHSWLRQVPEADHHIERAFKACREHGIRTSAEMCIFRRNSRYLKDSILWLAEAGCESLKINRLVKQGAAKNMEGEFLETEELIGILESFLHDWKEMKPEMEINCAGYLFMDRKGNITIPFAGKNPDAVAENCYACNSARFHMYLDASGHCLPCISYAENREDISGFPLILDHGLCEILSDSSFLTIGSMKLSEVYDENPDCRRCGYFNVCTTGCRARAKHTGCGNYKGKDRDCCEFFHKGYYQRLLMKIDELRD